MWVHFVLGNIIFRGKIEGSKVPKWQQNYAWNYCDPHLGYQATRLTQTWLHFFNGGPPFTGGFWLTLPHLIVWGRGGVIFRYLGLLCNFGQLLHNNHENCQKSGKSRQKKNSNTSFVCLLIPYFHAKKLRNWINWQGPDTIWVNFEKIVFKVEILIFRKFPNNMSRTEKRFFNSVKSIWF